MWRIRGSWFYLLLCDLRYLEVAWRSLYLLKSTVKQDVLCLWEFWINFTGIRGHSLYLQLFFPSLMLQKFSCFISFNMFLVLWLHFILQRSHLYYVGSSLSILNIVFLPFFSLVPSLFSFVSPSLYFLSFSALSVFVVIIKSSQFKLPILFLALSILFLFGLV